MGSRGLNKIEQISVKFSLDTRQSRKFFELSASVWLCYDYFSFVSFAFHVYCAELGEKHVFLAGLVWSLVFFFFLIKAWASNWISWSLLQQQWLKTLADMPRIDAWREYMPIPYYRFFRELNLISLHRPSGNKIDGFYFRLQSSQSMSCIVITLNSVEIQKNRNATTTKCSTFKCETKQKSIRHVYTGVSATKINKNRTF